MKSNIIAASILGACLVAAAFFYAGPYQFIRIDECTIVKANRLTGSVQRVSDVDCKLGF